MITTKEVNMSKLYHNSKYLLAPSLILVSLAGVIVGGPFAWTGVVLLFVGILIDTAIRKQSSSTMHGSDGETLANPAFQNMVMYMMLPVFVLLQLALAWRVYGYMTGMPVEVTSMIWGVIPFTSGITGLDLIGATLSTGIFAGIGIIYGHELSHTKGFAFLISRMTMALSGSAHFCYAHVYNHHLELASEDDPATAPRGRTIYGHYMLSHIGQSKFLFNMEKERLARMGKGFISWENRWIRGYLMSVPSVALFFAAGGWIGVAALATVWVISNFELEALNYLEHYGLIRVKDQPIDYRHNWDNNTLFTSWFFIEIGRQADHHDRGETHFWELENVGAPNTGWGYFTIFALALVPPLWHWYMRKRLATWDEKFATTEEKAVAARINKEVGYEGTRFDGDELSFPVEG
jgi:alkane 1-monooxygenase